ncbi:MAG: TrkH family potassium uptake protein [Candidatus Actinomarina sp.]|jgi:trk system potassium uptake protein TrkH
MLKIIIFISSAVYPVLAASLIPTIVYSYYEKEYSFANSLLILSVATLLLSFLIRKNILPTRKLSTIQGFGAVGISWILISIYGTIPYLLANIKLSYIDILFETISGFTTTGSSILTNIEAVSASLLLWRSTTQWLGGMGIVVLTITVLPLLGSGGINLFKAESPGPTADRLTPRFQDTAKLLWGVYSGLTLLETGLLYFSGLSFYSALNHSLTTLSTGGFSVLNSSVSEMTQSAKWIIILFMFIAGISFTLIFKSFQDFRSLLESTEFKFYSFIVVASSLIFIPKTLAVSSSLLEAVNTAMFTSLSLITTTGFTNADYEVWSVDYRAFILGLMFLGGMAGSTAGGLKTIRVIALLKSVRNEIRKILYPNAIFKIRMSKSALPEKMIESVQTFFILYVAIFVLGTFALSATSSISGINLSFEGILSSVASAMNNIGPGLNEVGPTQNFAFMDSMSKLVICFLMIVGRLEIFPIAILFYKKTWKN